MTEVRERLEQLVPDRPEDGDWDRVLVDAERPQHRRLGLVIPLPAAAAILAVLVLAWPLGNEQSGGVLDRALAVIGEGPVVHVVYRGESGSALVDLSSGEVTPLVADSELWYDPERGVHRRSRLGSVIQWDVVVPRSMVSERQERDLLALADNYRSALESGQAQVLGPGEVAGRAVEWIRVRQTGAFTEEVAVDRETSEPVYARITEDGLVRAGSSIVKLERLPVEAAPFDAKDRAKDDPVNQPEGGTGFGRLLAPGEFPAAVGGPAFWLGPSFEGEPLADAREFFVRESTTSKGLYLFYGELRRDGETLLRALSEPKVVLEEFRELPDFWVVGPQALAAREGSVLISNNRSHVGDKELPQRWGVVLRDGTYVSIEATGVRGVLEAAVALRPSDVEAVPPTDLDLAAIAREVETRKAHITEVSGPSEP